MNFFIISSVVYNSFGKIEVSTHLTSDSIMNIQNRDLKLKNDVFTNRRCTT